MKVLVTGSQGYIGCVVVGALRAAGHEVAGIDMLLYRGCDLSPVDDASAIPVDVRQATWRGSTRWSISPRCRTTRSEPSTAS